MSTENLREIIFDTETTGLRHENGDRIIEIGAIELLNKYPTGKYFHMYINPDGKDVHPDAERVHGISNAFLADKPKFKDILDDFLEFFSCGVLIAHNASFDMGFINSELKRIGETVISHDRVFDTLQLARRKHPMVPNSLDALCGRYGIDNSHREKHGALLDAELLAEVYIELLGGKQASLVLEQDDNDSNVYSDSGSADTGDISNLKRPKALPSRLSAEDLKRHNEFIETLGENAVWKKISV